MNDTPWMAIRLVNRDSARLVLERLEQDALKQLLGWYLHPNGGAQGMLVCEDAPIFDAALDCLAEMTDAMVREQHKSDDERGMFRMPHVLSLEAIGAVFGAGLSLGTEIRLKNEADSPFEEPTGMGTVLAELASFSLLQEPSIEEEFLCLSDLVAELVALEPAIPLVFKALQNMELKSAANGRRRSKTFRLSFFAGLVAAGICLPQVPGPMAVKHAEF